MQAVLPPEIRNDAGFESTRLRQFTIFLENKVGRLQTLVTQLEQNAGRIAGISIEESGDAALVRVICHHPGLARDALSAGGFSFSESELLAVELPPRTQHPLIALCAALLTAEINLHYAYPLLTRPHKSPVLAVYVDDPTLAARLLIKKGFGLVGESDLK